MTAKNQTDWSVEKLKKWAKPALKYPELIRIACTAMSNTEAKNLALEFTKEQGLEEKVAMACRWLRILRAKLSEEKFGEYIEASQKKQKQEQKMETHCFKCRRNIEMKNPKAVTLEGKSGVQGKCPNCGAKIFRIPKEEKEMEEKKKIKILLHDPEVEFDSVNAVRICNAILSKIATTDIIEELKFSPRFDYQYEQNHLRDLIIQILEEKYGLEPFIEVLEKNGIKVKICGNCKHCLPQHDPVHVGYCLHGKGEHSLYSGACYIDNCFETCKDWVLKEVSQK